MNEPSRMPSEVLPGTEARGRELLVVFRDVIAGDAGSWEELVDALARVLGLVPSYVPVAMRGEGWITRLLQASAGAPGPVLVLPHDERRLAARAGRPPSPLLRVVIASGDAGDVVRSVDALARRLRSGGVESTVVVVLTDGAVPPMWEGPGHHAAAWRHELQRRHGGAERVEVLPPAADAGRVIHDRAGEADVLVLVWRRAAAEGRAAVVRSALGTNDGLPCLLVPIDWADARGQGAPPAATRRVPRARRSPARQPAVKPATAPR